MTPHHYILATAGHVDHGKSALVKALTGTDPDRLPEEKACGITIDLGFAHLQLRSGEQRYDVGIIDVPGHEDFVRNMVAGIGSVDLSLLVVAADDGWMPQTEEHLHLLTYLAVGRGVVAITKADLVSDLQPRIEQVRARLCGTPLAGAPIVPTSVMTGQGLEELRQSLLAVLAQTPSPADVGKPRLAVDRVFSIRGAGTVVTGTLAGGRLARGQQITVAPTGSTARIRAVQSHGCELAEAVPGSRVALNLPDLHAGGIVRGNVVTVEPVPPTSCLDVMLWRSDRPSVGKFQPPAELRTGLRVSLHHGTAAVAARLRLVGTDRLASGQSALAQLRTETPIYLLGADRFVLRDWSARHTLAGGLVLRPQGLQRKVGSEAWRRGLAEQAANPDQPEPWILGALAVSPSLRRDAIGRDWRFGAAQIAVAIESLVRAGRLRVLGDWVALPATWQALRQQALDAVGAFHRVAPDRPGMPLGDLRRALPTLPSDAFTALLEELARADLVCRGAVVALPAHQPSLPLALRGPCQRIERALAAGGLQPPARNQLAPDPASRAALQYLLNTGQAVDIGPDVVLDARHYQQARAATSAYLSRHGPATVAELKVALATTRRVMVPLLEHLARHGFTRRHGDLHELAGEAAPVHADQP